MAEAGNERRHSILDLLTAVLFDAQMHELNRAAGKIDPESPSDARVSLEDSVYAEAFAALPREVVGDFDSALPGFRFAKC